MSLKIAIIGAGVISAITSLIIYLLNKKNNILIFELNKNISIENSKAINNAGTGHAGMCENNYIKLFKKKYYVKKNIRIYNKFNLTKNFFSLIKIINIFNLEKILINTPHIAYFFNKNNIKLKKIFKKIRFFNKSLKFTNNLFYLNKVFPLLIKKKKIKKKFSITYYKNGFDINYQFLSIKIFNFLTKNKIIKIFLNTKITKISNCKKKFFLTFYKIKMYKIVINFIFCCSGGSTLSLLKLYNKKISKKYFEFPINGTWLISEVNNFTKKHNLKVYSQTLKNNPPMSIPHLDIRNIFKEKKIFFGPFAGITFKILNNKNKFIFNNLNINFILDMIFFSIENFSTIKYLIKENFKTNKKKTNDIISFTNLIKNVYIKKAGKRLQILKKKKKKLKLNFGTKLIFFKNKKIAFLIGASPGASISVSIVLKLYFKWFPKYKKFLFKKNNKKNKIFNYILYLKGIEPFTF